MKLQLLAALLASAIVAGASADRPPLAAQHTIQRADPILLAQRRKTCKQFSSCEEAVILWCSGYRRADGDSDGIPCENVCHTKAQVDAIRQQIGC